MVRDCNWAASRTHACHGRSYTWISPNITWTLHDPNMCCLVLSTATSLGSINNETEYIAKQLYISASYLKRESWVLLGQEVPLRVLSNDNHLPIMKGLT